MSETADPGFDGVNVPGDSGPAPGNPRATDAGGAPGDPAPADQGGAGDPGSAGPDGGASRAGDARTTGGPRSAGRLRSAVAALRLGVRAAPASTLASVAVAAAAALGPVAAATCGKLLLDELARGTRADVSRAVTLALVGAAATVAALILADLATLASAMARRAISLDVVDRLYRRIGGLAGLRHLEDPAVQDRVRLAEQAAQTAPPVMVSFGVEVVQSLVSVASYLGVLIALWPPAALLLAAAVVPAVLAQLAVARRYVRTTETMISHQRRGMVYRTLLTDVRAAKETRIFGLRELFHGRMLDALRATSAAELAVQRRGSLVQSALAIMQAAVGAVGLVVIVHGVVRGRLHLGDVALFTAAVGGIQGALAMVIHQWREVSSSSALFAHYLDLMRLPDDLPDGSRPAPPLRTAIELRDVWFRYDDQGPWILRGVDLTIPYGATVGLVGVNGAGKSTLVKLLCRLYDPQRGRIDWDGDDLREFAVDSLRARYGVSFQDYMNYDLSAAENVGVGDVAHLRDEPRIRQAARLADVDATITALPRGYGTLLSRLFYDDDQERGVALSGGQWQRVALARSVMRADPDLLILDEPSSGLDAEAEYQIHTALRAHRRGRTSLLISHRLSALREADLIVVLGDGRIVEQGSHDELMYRAGEYARLFRLQASGYQDRRVEVSA